MHVQWGFTLTCLFWCIALRLEVMEVGLGLMALE